MGYYAIGTLECLGLAEIIKLSVAFRAQTLTEALQDGRWGVIGNIPPPPSMTMPISLWRGKAPYLRIYEWTQEAGGHERRATPEEIVGLEHDALWRSSSIVERLQMYLRGEPCPWVKIGR